MNGKKPIRLDEMPSLLSCLVSFKKLNIFVVFVGLKQKKKKKKTTKKTHTHLIYYLFICMLAQILSCIWYVEVQAKAIPCANAHTVLELFFFFLLLLPFLQTKMTCKWMRKTEIVFTNVLNDYKVKNSCRQKRMGMSTWSFEHMLI